MSGRSLYRYRFVIEYDGGSFSGWQSQTEGIRTIQEILQKAAFSLTKEEIIFWCAGRTDRGVHALGQVAHADFSKEISVDSLRRGINFYLKKYPIVVLDVCAVPGDFHARFSAISRHYSYLLLNRSSPAVLYKGRAWWICRPLSVVWMSKAALLLEGNHDFSNFRCAYCQAPSAVKTLDSLQITQHGEIIEIQVRARSFLHRQVRMMVGALVLVGLGRLHSEDVETLLRVRIKNRAIPTAPACGLYLVRVLYQNDPPQNDNLNEKSTDAVSVFGKYTRESL